MKHYLTETSDVLKSLETSRRGIDPKQAAERLEEHGKNKLVETRKKTIFQRLIDQLKDPMVIILIAAAAVSGVVGEMADAAVILVVVILNSILGVVQEGKAEKAIEALARLSSPFTRVRRGGHVMQIKSEELVPGDIVLLEAGDAVPADMRLIEASSLRIEEASLTGESVPVEKDTAAIAAETSDVPLGDRRNMAYMGTNVVYGRGEGVAVATGMGTEMGKIADIISRTEDEKTPLQRTLAGLSRILSICVLGISVFIFLFSVLRNGGFSGGLVLDMFLLAVSLAVAAIPEGLVAVVTVVLSIGVTRMSRRNAIIRRLTAVETLGCTQVIC
ncbi:MAG: HAD-IC family P-type ATPase, partial [Acetivibrionales bacterium]